MKLDANDLARWTRFAAKGGIGRCTAVQDCIAESPEDLMFLQNDEIVVLMQLQGQTGCYLGYCEGVVGRFRGSDVRFHAKLKRPVLTKRSSVAASPSVSVPGSAVSSPLSPSPLSAAVSPISGGLGDRWERSMSRERSVSVSAVTSPATSATSSPQIGVLKGLPASPFPSPPANLPSKATQETGRTSSVEVKAASKQDLGLEEDADLRTPMPGVAFNVGQPSANPVSLEESSNSHSRASRRGTQGTGDNADRASTTQSNLNNEPNPSQSRPGSAPPSDGESSSSKPARRRTGLADLFPAPPVPNPLADRQHTPSPSLGSGTEDAAFVTSKSSRRRTRILGDPSILSPPSSPLPGGNFTPSSTSPIPPSPGLRSSKAYEQMSNATTSPRSETPQSPTSRRKSVADVDKSARRRTGLVGDWTLAVQSDGEVLASPSPMRAEFALGEAPKEKEEERKEESKVEEAERVDEHEVQSGKDEQAASPKVVPAEPEPEAVESLVPTPASDVNLDTSLYDKASLRSVPSVSSTSSHSLLYASRRYDDEDNTFMSTDSAGGLLSSLQRRLDEEDGDRSRETNRGSIGLGIGLTMLQDMVDATSSEGSDFGDDGEEDNEEQWMPQRESNAQTPEPKGDLRQLSNESNGALENTSGDGALLASPESMQSVRTSSTTLNTSNDNSGMTSPSFPITPRPSGSFRIPVSVSDLENSIPVRDGMEASGPVVDVIDDHHDHDVGDEHDADEEDEDGEWDGYGDIYDNYRYSRYSLTSRKSRFSTMSTNKSALSIDESQDPPEAMPPMPSEAQFTSRRPSDAQMSTGSGDERASGNEQSRPSTSDKASTKHIPPPLNLTAPLKIHPKPLLSPPSSSGPTSPLSFRLKGDAVSSSSPIPPSTPSLAPSPFGGAASALRQRLESERVEELGAPTARPLSSISSEGEGPGGGIVIADEGSEIHGDIDTSKDEPSRVEEKSMDVSQEVEKDGDDTEVKIDLSMASMSISTSMTSERSESSSMMSGLTAEMRRMEAELDREGGNASVLSNLSNSVVISTPPLRLLDRASPRSEQFPLNMEPDKRALGGQRAVDQPEAPELQARPRPRPGNQGASPFLPHPGAPKPHPDVISGHRISTFGMPPVHPVHQVPPQQPPQQQHDTPESPSLHIAMRQAAMMRMGSNGVPRTNTIYGRTVVDLSSAVEPVPMVWSLEPFPPATTGAGPSAASRVPRRAATAAASPLSSSVVLQANADGEVAPVSMTPPPREGSPASQSSRVIPRANFFPKAAGSRPRSRSFSGFEAPPVNALPSGKSKDEAGFPARVGSMQSSRSGFLGELPPSRLSSSSIGSSNSGRAGHTPSPLSLPKNATSVSPAPRSPLAPKASPSPLAMSFSREDRQSEDSVLQPPPQLKGLGIRQVASTSALRPERPVTPPSEPPVQSPASTNQSPESSAVQASQSIASTAFQKLRRLSSTSRKHQRTVSQQSRSSTHSDTRSDAVSPPLIQRSSSGASPMNRSNSLKSKLSLSALRIRNASTKEEQSSPSTAPPTPLFEFDDHPETVQVKDIGGFEIIRPPMRQMSTEPGSDDSLPRDERPSLQINARTESPFSSISGGARSPIPPRFAESPEPMPRPLQVGDASEGNNANAEAHRSREQRWIAAMAAVPASQSRKSKKIRRLVLEGVPSSVRYLVWSHLVDSKAKIIPGVYDKFGKREKVAIVNQIEEDARRCFPDQQHLQEAKGPLVTLLTTYLRMVPDIEYQRSLVAIAGHLLLQAPEEDAFWMFVSIMDAHIRTYFSSKAVQMDVDASIFGKVVESTQPQLAKRLFVELGISPLEICRPWFSSVFATTLPPECVNRVWDVFLCEGPPFLFRIGLALLNLCRAHIESSKDRTSVLVILARPEALSLLPNDPDDLINSALSVKLKDDDVRKQRIKLEAQMKRQTQSLASRSTPSLVSKISLPR